MYSALDEQPFVTAVSREARHYGWVDAHDAVIDVRARRSRVDAARPDRWTVQPWLDQVDLVLRTRDDLDRRFCSYPW